MNKNTGAGKGSARRSENFAQIQKNWDNIVWKKKKVDKNPKKD